MKNKLLSVSGIIIGSTLLAVTIAPNAKAISFKKENSYNVSRYVSQINTDRLDRLRQIFRDRNQDRKRHFDHLKDFHPKAKHIRKKQTPEEVPEPLTILGTMFAGGFGYVMKRKNKTAD